MKKTLALGLLCCTLTAPAWAEGVAYDPYEGYNRFMFGINDTVDRNVLAPVARGYRAVTPRPVRSGIGNFFNNLRDLLSVGHNLLRLDIEKAGTDLVRVGINTTFGFGGLIDIAGAASMPNNKTTLGDTLASWGWKNSNYFVYPLLGPSTVRDAVGTTAGLFYPVNGMVFQTPAARWTATGLQTIDTRASLLDLTDGADQAAIDRYAYIRDAYMAARARQTGAELPGGDDYVPTFEDGSAAEPAPADTAANTAPAAEAVTETPSAPTLATDAGTGTLPEAAANHNTAPADTGAAEPAVRDLPPNTIHISIVRGQH